MRKIKCARCGEIIPASGEKYLCDKCALEARRESVFLPRTCRACGAKFVGAPRAWYCPNCREQRRKEQNKKRGKTTRPLGSIDHCQHCGNEYVVNSGRQRYCPSCKTEAVSENVRKHKRKYVAANQDVYTERKHRAKQDRKVCIICGKPFTSSTTTVTCSENCAAALKKLRQEEADYRRGKRKTPPGKKYDSGLPKSGIPGITARRNGKWQVSYHRKYIGVYDTVEEAVVALEQYKNKEQN